MGDSLRRVFFEDEVLESGPELCDQRIGTALDSGTRSNRGGWFRSRYFVKTRNENTVLGV